MSSVAQVAIGILILGAAFIIGSQLRNHQSDSVVANDQSADSSSEVLWQRPEKIEDLRQQASDSKGLIDMPVAKRRVASPAFDSGGETPDKAATETTIPPTDQSASQQPALVATKQKPVLTSEIAPTKPVVQKVDVEPDFTHMESEYERSLAANDVGGKAQSQPFSRSTKIQAANSLGKVSPRPAAPIDSSIRSTIALAEAGVRDLPTRETTTPMIARKIPPVDPTTADVRAQPRVPAGLTPQAKSGMVSLKSKRVNRITLETNQFVRHVTESGETLQRLSEKYYGKPDYYLDIYLANQDVLPNPATVPVGKTLRIPLYE